jgi:hypothetical protein
VLRKISGHKRKDQNIKTTSQDCSRHAEGHGDLERHRNILKCYMHIAGCKASTKDSLSWRRVAA